MPESFNPIKTRTAIQAARLQGLCYEAAMSYRQAFKQGDSKPLSKEDALALANLVKSWDMARDAVRVAKGKPLPGSLRPKDYSPRKRKRPPTAEPTGPAAPAEPTT